MSEEAIYQQLEICQRQRDAAKSELANKDEAYRGAHLMCEDLKTERAELREELARTNRTLANAIEQIEDQQQRQTAAEQRNSELEQSVELHAQVIRDQEQMIQNHRIVNEKLEIEVQDLHGVVQRLNAARRPVRHDVSGGAADRQDAGLAALKPTESGASE